MQRCGDLDSNENVVEWISGDKTVKLTLQKGKLQNRVLKLAKEDSSIRIIAENMDGSIYAEVPLGYLKINPKKKLSEEQSQELRTRLANNRIASGVQEFNANSSEN